jgi:hypothetical protein
MYSRQLPRTVPARYDSHSNCIFEAGLWSRSIKFCCPDARVKGAVAERETRRARRGSMPAHLSTFYFPPFCRRSRPTGPCLTRRHEERQDGTEECEGLIQKS